MHDNKDKDLMYSVYYEDARPRKRIDISVALDNTSSFLVNDCNDQYMPAAGYVIGTLGFYIATVGVLIYKSFEMALIGSTCGFIGGSMAYVTSKDLERRKKKSS
jgi:hypothetical protein